MFAPRGKGYDSESEDEGRRQVQASRSKLEGKPSLQAGGGPDDKKKKKIKLPPQETIEQIWKRFSKEQFTKALQILPFDPVPASTASVRANELLTAGYERAVDECRRRVRKIIQECKRVNKRYRDPGFDLVCYISHSQSGGQQQSRVLLLLGGHVSLLSEPPNGQYC